MAALMTRRRWGVRAWISPSEHDIDEFVEMLGKFERGEMAPDEWRRFRLVRGTYGQRQDGVQMLRVKAPQGIVSVVADARVCRRRVALLARLLPHHHATEHPVSFRPAEERRSGDARARGRRAHDARGVRQLGAQHHRLPVRGDVRRRNLRRHAVRRGADAATSCAIR